MPHVAMDPYTAVDPGAVVDLSLLRRQISPTMMARFVTSGKSMSLRQRSGGG